MTLLVHAACSFMMVGVIWTVQLVHYPLFLAVGRDHWARYHARHVQTIGFIVGPLMTAELFSGALLAFRLPESLAPWAIWLNLALIVTVWASTAFLQMPLHQQLAKRFDSRAVRNLVATNWLRTAAWSAHGLLVVLLLLQSR
jgi:hypothetical protein